MLCCDGLELELHCVCVSARLFGVCTGYETSYETRLAEKLICSPSLRLSVSPSLLRLIQVWEYIDLTDGMLLTLLILLSILRD